MSSSRREFEGARLHPLLGEILVLGANLLRRGHPHQRIINAEFIASAIPELARRGLIYRIDPRIGIPKDLSNIDVQAAEKQVGHPIWMPKNDLAERWVDIWDELQPVIRGHDVVWLIGRKARNNR